VALAILGALALAGAAALVAVEDLLAAGGWMVAAGFALGLPTGLVYHVLLRRAALEHGILEKGWYWRPTSFHERLPATSRGRFLPWFVAGAVGFMVVVIGIVAIITAMALALAG